MEVTIQYNGQAVTVEVTLEVYEYLDRADHKAENLSHEQRRHWGGREFDEYIVATEGAGIYGETPEEYLSLPHGNTGRTHGRSGHLHRGTAPPVLALRAGRTFSYGDWNSVRLLQSSRISKCGSRPKKIYKFL